MGFLEKIFGRPEQPISNTEDFWRWFSQNEKNYHKVVSQHSNIDKDFFSKLAPKLNQLREGIFYLTGMWDESTVELILTADGNLKNISTVEEIISSAPKIDGWRFTAHKPPMKDDGFSIEMYGHTLNSDTLAFQTTEKPDYPDEIDITIIASDLTDENADNLMHGIYIYLDNFLGELEFLEDIDNLEIVGPDKAGHDQIPISKLKSYLKWRKKEFVEKYDGVRYNTESDNHTMLEATTQDGFPIIAVVNEELLNWDAKASHQWMIDIDLKFDGAENNGLPTKQILTQLHNIEDTLIKTLKDEDGFLTIGHETAKGVRTTFLACTDFRNAGKQIELTLENLPNGVEGEFQIRKDKYWRSVAHLRSN